MRLLTDYKCRVSFQTMQAAYWKISAFQLQYLYLINESSFQGLRIMTKFGGSRNVVHNTSPGFFFQGFFTGNLSLLYYWVFTLVFLCFCYISLLLAFTRLTVCDVWLCTCNMEYQIFVNGGNSICDTVN